VCAVKEREGCGTYKLRILHTINFIRSVSKKYQKNKNKDSGRERKEEIKINAGLWLWMYWILRIIGEDSISGSLKKLCHKSVINVRKT